MSLLDLADLTVTRRGRRFSARSPSGSTPAPWWDFSARTAPARPR